MIPLALASKIGIYQIRLGDLTVTVNVINNPSLLYQKLTALKLYLLQRRVIGFDTDCANRWLVLSAGSSCLVIDMREMAPIPECLKTFLADETISFVWIGMKTHVCGLESLMGIKCKTVVELGYLAACILKKPSLVNCASLEQLAAEVGFDVEPKSGSGTTMAIYWSARVFSEEEMKFVIRNPHYCRAIANKLFDKL